MSRDIRKIAESVVRTMSGMSQQEQKVHAVTEMAKQTRRIVDKAYKDLLSVSKKVKYVEEVGNAAQEAIWALNEADLKTKAVVDAGHRYLGE